MGLRAPVTGLDPGPTLPELQECLDRLGIRLSARGDKLHVDAPAGVVTAEVKAALASHKAALLRLLAEGESPAPPPPTDRGWRACIAYWPTAWRQRWADRAGASQAAGDFWDVAEWSAFVATVAEIAEAEARGEVIPFADPAEGLTDADALRQINALAWDGTSQAQALEEAGRHGTASTSTPRRQRP
jgi:hypothetical protein